MLSWCLNLSVTAEPSASAAEQVSRAVGQDHARCQLRGDSSQPKHKGNIENKDVSGLNLKTGTKQQPSLTHTTMHPQIPEPPFLPHLSEELGEKEGSGF